MLLRRQLFQQQIVGRVVVGEVASVYRRLLQAELFGEKLPDFATLSLRYTCVSSSFVRRKKQVTKKGQSFRLVSSGYTLFDSM